MALSRTPQRTLLIRSLIALLLSGAVVILCRFTVPPEETSHAGVRLLLPDQVAAWAGHEEPTSEAELKILPADTQIIRRRYQNIRGETILASIVLAGAEKRSIHRPEVCLPGQGWTVKSSDVIPISITLTDSNTAPVLDATRLLITRPIRLSNGTETTLRAYLLYWYVGDGVTTPLHWRRIWITSWDRVVHHRNHRWAYVYVLAPISEGLDPNGKNPEETLDMMRTFIAGALPTFQDLPHR